MFRFSSSRAIASVATIALAAVPALTATGAQAAPTPVVVKVSDLDIRSARDAQVLEQRVFAAADRFCSAPAGRTDLSSRQACKQGVRLEVRDQLAARGPTSGELAQR
jgi:UrcA family protein